MASKKLTLKAYIKVEGKDVLWYEIDENDNVTYYLPKEKTQAYVKAMLKNTGERMSQYINNHPEATLWGATNN